MQHKLQASGGYECLALGFPSSQIAETLNLAADLEHSIVQQQEHYLFMLSRFIFQVPFFWSANGLGSPSELEMYTDSAVAGAMTQLLSSLPSCLHAGA